ncbi:MAG: hypothetical protein ABI165_03930 [Bryobacteraceae bacterium]
MCLSAGIASAAIDGTVVNATTRKPQASIGINLVQPSQAGMQKLAATTTDAQGKFSFAQPAEAGPMLLQVIYKGVDYNHLLTPGAPTTGVDVDIYDVSSAAGEAKVARDMILLEPSATEVSVDETVLYQNAGKTTYSDPAHGTFRFYLPEAAGGKVLVNATGLQGMALRQQAEKTREPNVYKVNFPLKPGETRFDVTYTVPATGKFSSKILHKEGATNLVAPRGVTLTGDAITALGQEPSTQATVYGIKGDEYTISIQGMGTLRNAQPAPGDDNGPPPIQSEPPKLYDQLYWILALTGAILALGFALLYRGKELKPGARTEPSKQRK